MRLFMKIYLRDDGSFVLGPGRVELLKDVEALGSLSKAAEKHNMSYRWAWGRLHKTKEALGNPLIQRAKDAPAEQGKEGLDGRSMTLTPEGKELVAWFEEVNTEVDALLRKLEARMPAFLRETAPPADK